MLVTATEFKSNIGKYLSLVGKEDIIITKNGKQIARLTDIKDGKKTITDSLIGIIPDAGIDLKAARRERLARHENLD
ncbi:MAG: type II toxin-antitoxin system prevent-host-death family antitoxin [Bacillota bacterium]|jgi:prevent-host-death family protein|nr:type II toxin-antitoxin system prevent-host-death family antitoxin [Bacillota bacterium]